MPRMPSHWYVRPQELQSPVCSGDDHQHNMPFQSLSEAREATIRTAAELLQRHLNARDGNTAAQRELLVRQMQILAGLPPAASVPPPPLPPITPLDPFPKIKDKFFTVFF